MAQNVADAREPGAGTVGGLGSVEPSFRNALPHYLALAIFPFVINAAIHGGWWLALPLAFYWVASLFETRLGDDERNMDPENMPEDRLFWYKLPVWVWAMLWPVTLVYSLWQMLVAGHLVAWEIALMAVVLTMVAQSVFIVSHEMIHRLSVWERRFGEFLLASVSYPHYATEHIYIHHALVGTPWDVGSAPKGQSFWHYFPREVTSNLTESWRVQRRRLARRHLPVWHYSNPFWRYFFECALWYGLIWRTGAPTTVPRSRRGRMRSRRSRRSSAPRRASGRGSTVPRSCSTPSGERSSPTWTFPTASARTRSSRRSPAAASHACTGHTNSASPR